MGWYWLALGARALTAPVISSSDWCGLCSRNWGSCGNARGGWGRGAVRGFRLCQLLTAGRRVNAVLIRGRVLDVAAVDSAGAFVGEG